MLFRSENQGLADVVCEHLKLENKVPDHSEWEKMIKRIKGIKDKGIKIAIIGKYVELEDSYLSVVESLKHGGYANNTNVEIKFINSEKINETNVNEKLDGFTGILVPGGFGNRGIKGKIESIKFARENNIPFLGICLGMQLAVGEFSINVLGIKDANSSEIAKTDNDVIHIMNKQKDTIKKGATMRLGEYPCILKSGSIARKIYGKDLIYERHRHRYEFNNFYKEKLEAARINLFRKLTRGRFS